MNTKYEDIHYAVFSMLLLFSLSKNQNILLSSLFLVTLNLRYFQKFEDHQLSAVHDCLFNIFAVVFHVRIPLICRLKPQILCILGILLLGPFMSRYGGGVFGQDVTSAPDGRMWGSRRCSSPVRCASAIDERDSPTRISPRNRPISVEKV
jgi:hypothetical protein